LNALLIMSKRRATDELYGDSAKVPNVLFNLLGGRGYVDAETSWI
jgi:hypothetical protein